MALYYLIPIRWDMSGKQCKSNMQDVIETGEGVRTVKTSRKKAVETAHAYARELNDGQAYDLELVAGGLPMTNVIVTPWHAARGYVRFIDWPCNKHWDH